MLEILAPAAGEDTVDAAIKFGADAVYLGVGEFSARKNARNFTFEQLYNIVRKCHFHKVKIYLALNTLIFDDELERLLYVLKEAVRMFIDGIIVQDLAVLSLLKKHFPKLPVHGSTQMTVTSVKGAYLAKELGLTRIVLARELSFNEIKDIVSSVDIETEVFIHGSLCVSLSGQCYLSSLIGGRSGNRGYCAQPCRLPVKSQDNNYALSLKDLSIIDKIAELQKIGVTSIKIEGRMKSADYVAITVNAAFSARNGDPFNEEILKSAFSRNGFTNGYYINNLNSMNGIRTKEDVLDGTKIDISSLNECKREYPIEILIELKASKPVSCTFKHEDLSITVTGEIPLNAQNHAITKEIIEKQITKLGGTYFRAEKIICDMEEGLFLALGKINSLRREAVQKLTDAIIQKHTGDY